VCLLVALPAVADHQWGSYHWARSSNPIVLQLGDNVHSAWDAYLVEAEQDWEQSTVLSLSIIPGSASVRRCNPDTGEIEVCAAKYGRNGWLGVAGIWASGDHITKGYTKLNDTYFNTASYNTPAWRRLVTCQEIGHDFGLDHQDENFSNTNLGTCMDYTSDPDGGEQGPSNEHPNAHDYEQLQSMYSHLDVVAALPYDSLVSSFARPRKVEEFLNKAEQWGAPVRFDAHGRPNVFVLELGANHAGQSERILTHVFWAPVDLNDESPGRPEHEFE
jgi:hypothetical protein